MQVKLRAISSENNFQRKHLLQQLDQSTADIFFCKFQEKIFQHQEFFLHNKNVLLIK